MKLQHLFSIIIVIVLINITYSEHNLRYRGHLYQSKNKSLKHIQIHQEDQFVQQSKTNSKTSNNPASKQTNPQQTSQNQQNNKKQPENQQKPKHYHKALNITIYVVVIGGLILAGVYYYMHYKKNQGIIDDHVLNQEAQMNQQVLTKQQQKGLQNYKFQSQIQDDEVNIQKPDLDKSIDENLPNSTQLMSDQSCFIMELKKDSCITGQKVQDHMKAKKNQQFVYFEIEILEMRDPSTILQVGFKPDPSEVSKSSGNNNMSLLESPSKAQSLMQKEFQNYVGFNSQGVVECMKMPKFVEGQSLKPPQMKVYDYKANQLKNDYIFFTSMQDYYFQEKQKAISVSGMDKKQHNIKVNKNRAKKIHNNNSGNIEDDMVLGLPCFEKNNIYEFQFHIHSMKSSDSIKIGICGSKKWDKKGSFKNFVKQRYFLQSDGKIDNVQFLDEDDGGKQDQKNISLQQQHEEIINKKASNVANTQNSYIKFRSGSKINCKVDFNKYTVTFSLVSSKKANEIYYTINIPSNIQQICPLVQIGDLYDEVSIENGSMTPQNLSYGEILGVGLSLQTGRVWLSMNGTFLNQPTAEERQKMEKSKKGGQEKSGFFSGLFSKSSSKTKEENKEVEEVDEEVEKKLAKRIVQLNPKKLTNLMPFVSSSGPVKVNVNIGGKPFSLYQKGSIDYGFL